MRLDRFLSNNTVFSRKEIKQFLRSESVFVNNDLTKDPALKLADKDRVKLNGELIARLGRGYLMLNKPKGVICANSDPNHPTVFDLLDESLTIRLKGLHVAGRLDIDTTGLVLITGDGQWSHKITSPKKDCIKTYRVLASEFITDNMISKLESGIHLSPENIRTKPAQVQRIAKDEILLKISEGKYHQVKRMLHAVGNSVDQLHRVSIGSIELDPNLAPGEFRQLIEEEIENI